MINYWEDIVLHQNTHKKRKIYYKVFEELCATEYDVVFICGMNGVGKSTVLTQLQRSLGGVYVDFSKCGDTVEMFYEAIDDADHKFLYLDSIEYLSSFDQILACIEKTADAFSKKIVCVFEDTYIFRRLFKHCSDEKTLIIHMLPIDFEEYLYFTGFTKEYGEMYTPTRTDFLNFLVQKGISANMKFALDEMHLHKAYSSMEAADLSHMYVNRRLFDKETYKFINYLVEYTFYIPLGVRRWGHVFSGSTNTLKNYSWTDTILELLKSNPNNCLDAISRNFTNEKLKDILIYLFCKRYLFVELCMNEGGNQELSSFSYTTSENIQQMLIIHRLVGISPLFYSKLLEEELRSSRFQNDDQIIKHFLEITIRSEILYKKDTDGGCNDGVYKIYRYQRSGVVVDIVTEDLLIQIEFEDKPEDKIYINKVLPERKLVRILTTNDRVFEKLDGCYRIEWVQVIYMISNGSIYRLDRENVTQTQ